MGALFLVVAVRLRVEDGIRLVLRSLSQLGERVGINVSFYVIALTTRSIVVANAR